MNDIVWSSVSEGRWGHTADDGTLFVLVRDRHATGTWWFVDRSRCPNPQTFWLDPADHPDFTSVLTEATRIVKDPER